MLYNKDWDKPKTKPKHRSLEGVIAWLETKDPTCGYVYIDPTECLAAQYHHEHNKRYVYPLVMLTPFGRMLERIGGGNGFMAKANPYQTYGEALARARALQP